ncbi:GMP/IMP nucleotidase [Catenovulum sp. 2E275]|uniref:GMP/IMP nucleotidase n=1 Tax=Catenovulum sp. 2E275 TaxID=2980497 RepID=UPI0021D38D3D|nr:GMP/IMP nucleotidase [Catenovulum sp. 2E275]MCU4674363.1 GMP/IMP nucleotidase [Catenovulum sp. 2E275]
MLQWQDIDTVLLDMDGTLLDLYFDNHFWLSHLPMRYAQIHQKDINQVKQQLKQSYQALQGQLKWYCFDYWENTLNLDIMQLKAEVEHLIQVRDSVPEFLTALKNANKKVILLTNSHPKGLKLKLNKTQLTHYFDQVYSTHEFGFSKESQKLWQALIEKERFDKNRTLFVDDSLDILHSAKQFGIKHLIAIANPDSQQPSRNITEFYSIEDYWALIKALKGGT